jgi:hypothetical protein
MRPFRTRRHHPLATTGNAIEHLVLRHFGLELRTEPKPSSARLKDRAGTRDQPPPSSDGRVL